MSYIPEDELKDRGGITMAPMIDFLFLMLAAFASLAVTRIALRDTEVTLVQAHTTPTAPTDKTHFENADYKVINLSVSGEGEYKWVTEVRDHKMPSVASIAEELLSQYQRGLLPEEKEKTLVFLKIDRQAKWESILTLMLSIKELGFDVHPVYEPL